MRSSFRIFQKIYTSIQVKSLWLERKQQVWNWCILQGTFWEEEIKLPTQWSRKLDLIKSFAHSRVSKYKATVLSNSRWQQDIKQIIIEIAYTYTKFQALVFISVQTIPNQNGWPELPSLSALLWIGLLRSGYWTVNSVLCYHLSK